MAIIAEEVRYAAGDLAMHGRIYRDDAATRPRPGVLVYPDGFGLAEQTYEAAEEFAKLGYVGMACDLYGEAFCSGGPTPEVRERNGRVVGEPGLIDAVAVSAYDLLRARPDVDAARIAAAGYCFGGTLAMNLAFAGLPIAAVASYHPSFRGMALEGAAKVTGRMQIFIGVEDYASPPAERARLEAAFAGTPARWRMTLYGAVKHDFTHPDPRGMGDMVGYDAEAHEDSWNDTLAMFDRAFRELAST